MTTLEPGASVVFTHGLRSSPRSTALRASSAAPSMTDGLDVFVHEVIAAITTAPWSSSKVVPSSSRTATRRLGRPAPAEAAPAGGAAARCGRPASPLPLTIAGGSLAGNDCAELSSTRDGGSAALAAASEESPV
jgi:hypothetical protein